MASLSGRRRLFCIQVALGAAFVAVLANCSGGERPPPAIDNPVDGGGVIVQGGPAGAVTIGGYDPATGIVFGDNGFVNCGAQGSDKVITLKNPSQDVVNFTAKLSAGATFYKVNPTTGGVP